ncbi:MAG: FeoB-associated Cys-rich membrane protein [Bacteroidetes bacterium]|nr:FeoB-associated Cys-rich membrane protein [Bacteroidota bacterium]
MTETILLILIVGGASVFIIYRLYRTMTRKNCDKGCNGNCNH